MKQWGTISLDLILTKKKELVHEIKLIGTLGEIQLVILVLEIAKKENPQHILTANLDFRKGDFKNFREDIWMNPWPQSFNRIGAPEKQILIRKL